MLSNDIVDYVAKNKELDKMLSSICGNKMYIDDLKQEFLLILLEEDGDRLKKIYDEGKIWNWCYVILNNQWNSKTSPFYKKYRKDKMFDYELDWIVDKDVDDYEIKVVERVEDILKGIHWYDAHIFRLYYFERICDETGELKKPLTLRGIEKLHTEKDMKIDHVSVFLSVKKTKKKIFDILKKEGLMK